MTELDQAGLKSPPRKGASPAQGICGGCAHRHAQVLEVVPDALVVVDDNGAIEWVNGRTESMFGYSRSELVSEPLTTLIPEAAASSEAGSGMEFVGRRKDGVAIAVEVSFGALRAEGGMAVVASIRDISERRRREAVKPVAERVATAVDGIEEAFVLFDNSDRLVFANGAYRRLLAPASTGPLVGTSYEELLRAWIRDLDFPDDAARSRFREEQLMMRRRERTRSVAVHAYGGRSFQVTDRRTAGGTVTTVRDRTQDEQRAVEMARSRAAAESVSAAKTEFFSSMSHELRTPLNAILGFAQLLGRDRKDPLSDRHKERVEQILKGGQHILRVINDLLDLSHIEAGTMSVSTQPVRVADVLDEVLHTLEPMADLKGVHLAIDGLPQDLPTIAADSTRFAQILINFGSNALKYNRPAGSVTFAASSPRPGRVRVTVRDTGMGIPAEKQARLFQPFERAGQETGSIEGTGIGLVITKRLSQLMNGDVGFRSVEGEGSEFWVDLPVHLPVDWPGPQDVRANRRVA